jgi:hypothetical protein
MFDEQHARIVKVLREKGPLTAASIGRRIKMPKRDVNYFLAQIMAWYGVVRRDGPFPCDEGPGVAPGVYTWLPPGKERHTHIQYKRAGYGKNAKWKSVDPYPRPWWADAEMPR